MNNQDGGFGLVFYISHAFAMPHRIYNRSSRQIFCLSIAFLLCSICSQIAGQAGPRLAANQFTEMVCWSAKNGDGRTSAADIFLEISPEDLVFVKNDNQSYTANFEIDLSILNQHQETLFRKTIAESFAADTYEDAKNHQTSKLYKIPLSLPDGNFTAVAVTSDLNSDRTEEITGVFTVQNETNYDFDISDVLLSRRQEVMLPDGKTVSSVLPYPTKIYGLGISRLYYYFEIYNPEAVTDSVEYSISYVTPDHRQVVVREDRIKFDFPKMPVQGSFLSGDFEPGEYKLMVEVGALNHHIQFARQTNFMVFQDPCDLRFRTFDTIVIELKLVTGKEEWEQLTAIEKSISDDLNDESKIARQQTLIDAYWEKRDPTPNTIRNEIKIEFYKRLNIARQLFGFDGYKLTDRGKVFVLFGEPDEISQNRAGGNSGSIETWNYFENSMEIIFQDQLGYGTYFLIWPDNLFGEK